MTLILATFRRLIVQDKLVRDGRWSDREQWLADLDHVAAIHAELRV